MKFDYFENVNFLKGLSEIEALDKLKEMTLLKIKGQDSSKSILISGMLHGCEPCGFRAILKEINFYLDNSFQYPIDIYFLIGNVKAAKLEPIFTHRLMPNGLNYNRIWLDNPGNKDEEMAHDILNFLSEKNIQGHLDLHSFNAKSTKEHIFTASMNEKNLSVAKKLVNYIFILGYGHGSLIQKTIQFGPAVVVECGTNNTKDADDFAVKTLQKFFIEMNVKEGKNKELENDIFVDMIIIKVNKDVKVAWSNEKQNVDLTLRDDVESLNIRELLANDFFGWADNLDVFLIKDKRGQVNPSEIFELRDGKIYTKKKFVPNLMATKEFITKESGFYFFTKFIE